MDRRKFLNLSLPATGAVFLAPGLFNMQAMAEINRQFSGKSNFEEYDLVINGAGLSGYFAAGKPQRTGKWPFLAQNPAAKLFRCPLYQFQRPSPRATVFRAFEVGRVGFEVCIKRIPSYNLPTSSST